jgi:uncharacterized lipoprotein
VAVLVGLSLAGCAHPVPVNYSPGSTLTADGTIEVADFKYMPALNGSVTPNQLKNTALGAIKIDRNVDSFYRDAVFTELRFVGIKTANSHVQLSGEIKEFFIDDLGYSVDWRVDVRYLVKDKSSGTVTYDAEKVVTDHTAKGINAFETINRQIRTNVEALIKDPDFIKAIN